MTEAAATPTPLERAIGALGGGPASRVLAAILERRGVVTPEEVASFLRPTLADGLRAPEAIPGVPAMAASLADAIATRRPVVVAAGRSLDAALGAVLLRESLAGLGAAVSLGEAAGTDDALRLVLGPIDDAAPAGLVLRSGDATPVQIDPDGATPFSLALRAWYVLLATRQALRQRGRPATYDLRRGLDLVALGTIASGTELVAENRVVVRAGLRRLVDQPRPIFVGMREAAAVVELTAAAVDRHLLPRLDAVAAQGLLLLDGLIGVEALADARAVVSGIELGRAAAGPVVDGAPSLVWGEVAAEVSLAEVTPRFVAGLGLLEPCGAGNPAPLLRARRARVDGVRLVGDPASLRAKVRLRQDGRTVTGFLRGAAVGDVLPGSILDVRFRVALVTWQDRERIELEIVTAEPVANEAQVADYPDESAFLTVRSSPAT